MIETTLKKRPHLIPCIIAALMLLGSLARLPYGYYQLLRFVVCGASVYVAYIAYNWQKLWVTYLFSFIALLFNPLVPIHLSTELWQPIDLVCSALFIYAIAALAKLPQNGREVPSTKRRR